MSSTSLPEVNHLLLHLADIEGEVGRLVGWIGTGVRAAVGL